MLKKNTILIADDDISNIVSLMSMLQMEYTMFVAKNGHEAVQATRDQLPDLILLDIMMPEMDGYEVVAALRKDYETREIPVIFITSLDRPEDEEHGLAVGAVDYISKPFLPGIVRLRIRNQMKIINQIRTIERLSLIDQLTEIPNRRSFDKRLDNEWKRAMRDKECLSMLMIDIDDFNAFNERHGHLQGDIVLQIAAGTLTRTLKRAGDFAARWGGEEFAALLPGTDMAGAMQIAELYRENIEKVDVVCTDNNKDKITVSVGVNTICPTPDDDIGTFISGSDVALYVAKEMGKNRVNHYKDTSISIEV